MGGEIYEEDLSLLMFCEDSLNEFRDRQGSSSVIEQAANLKRGAPKVRG